MPRILLVLAVLAAIAVSILVLSSPDPDSDDPTPPRETDRGERTSGRPETPAEPAGEGGCVVRGTVIQAGTGVPATLELFLTIPGEREARGPSSLSSEAWLTRQLSANRSVGTETAAEDGSFRLEGLVPGEYRLVARAEDGATGHARVDLPASGAVALTDINLTAGRHTLRGRLVSAAGEPFPALVWVVPGSRPMTVMKQLDGTAPARTDDAGAFSVPGLDEGTVNVSVLSPGSLFTTFIGVGVPRNDELVLVVDEEFVPVGGHVLTEDDGTAVAGARISVWGQDRGRATTLGTTTAADGTFSISAPPGEISIALRAPGFVPHRTKRRTSTDLEVRLSRYAIVSGRVVNAENDEPVAGVSVRARTLDTGNRSRLRTDTVSGPDGSFRIEAAPGDTMVYAFGDGWISEELIEPADPKQCRTAFVLSPGEERTVTLRVTPAARAEGVVLDSAGRGVAGAVVFANRVGETARAATIAPHRPAGATGMDGRFEIDTLVPGLPYDFSTRPAGFGWNRSEVHTANRDEPIRLTLRLPEPRFIEVRVVDSNGDRPIAGARVRVSTAAGEWRTGEDGVVVAGPASPGVFTASADHSAYVASRRGTRVEPPPDGEEAPPVVLRLSPAFRITGLAVLEDGRPHTTGTVYSTMGRGYSGATVPGNDGSFRLSRLAAGTHIVIAQGVRDGRRYVGEVTVEAGAVDVLVTLRDRGTSAISSVEKATILVRATDREGKPVIGGRAQLWGEFGGAGRDLAGGEVKLFRMSGKEVRAVVTGARSGTGDRLEATLSGPVDLEKGEVTVVLEPALTVIGELLEEDGSPVVGVSLSAVGRFELPDGGYTREGWHARTRTGRDGTFTLTGLGKARYRLDLDLPSIYKMPKRVEVRPGDPKVTIRLERALSGTLRVTDTDGRPVSGAVVRISGSLRLQGGRFSGIGGSSPPPQTDPAGLFRFGPLDPKYEYALRVVPPKGREELAEFEVKGWKPADTEITLMEGLPVEGHIRLIGGRTLPGMSVWCRPAGGSSRSVKPGPGGHFAFANLPPGPVELGIRVDRIGMVTWNRRIEVQAGWTDVVYDVDLGFPLFVEIENWPEGQREYQRFATLVPSSGMPENPSLVPRARLGREIRFEGLPADETYTLRIIGMDDGTCYVKDGIRATIEPLRVQLVPGKTIRGRLVIPPGHGRPSVAARSPFDSVGGKVNPDGSFEIRGLPEGAWHVVAQAYGEGTIWSKGEKSVPTGAEVTITLEPREN